MELIIGLAVILGLGYLVINLLSRRFCDMCGVSAICRSVNGFTLCRKCARIAETSTTSIGDLIAQAVATRSVAEASKRGTGVWVVALALIAGAGFLWLRPQLMAPRVPVVVSMRDSVVGEGKVLILNNESGHQLTVTVRVERDGQATPAERNVTVPPDGSKEIGWAEGIAVNAGDKVTLSHPQYRSMTWNIQ